MERITQKHLDGLIDRLNRITGSQATYYLDHEFGGVKLARVVNDGGGISNPIYMGYETKREAYNLIAAFISGIEQYAKEYTK